MEYLAVVDEHDREIGKATYDELYANKLPHRIVHVLVYNDKGELAVQLRSEDEVFCPGHWSTSVGGHVQAGESYEEAALRESLEELGAELDHEHVTTIRYEDPNVGFHKYVRVFKAVHNGPFEYNPKEVAQLAFFSREQLREMLERNEKFHPELKHFIETDVI